MHIKMQAPWVRPWRIEEIGHGNTAIIGVFAVALVPTVGRPKKVDDL